MQKKKIVDLVDKLGLSQPDLGKYLSEYMGKNYSQPTLSKMLKGRRDIKADELAALVEIFKKVIKEKSINLDFEVTLEFFFKE